MVLGIGGQYGAELVNTLWYLVCKRRYRLVIGGTGSVWGGNGWYLVVLSQYGAVGLIADVTG